MSRLGGYDLILDPSQSRRLGDTRRIELTFEEARKRFDALRQSERAPVSFRDSGGDVGQNNGPKRSDGEIRRQAFEEARGTVDEAEIAARISSSPLAREAVLRERARDHIDDGLSPDEAYQKALSEQQDQDAAYRESRSLNRLRMEGMGQGVRELYEGTMGAAQDVGSTASRPFDRETADRMLAAGQGMSDAAEELRQEQDQYPEASRLLGGAIRSAATMAPGVAVGAVATPAAGFATVAATFGAEEANQALYDAEQAGVRGNDRLVYAAKQTAIELLFMSLFQRFGLGGLEARALSRDIGRKGMVEAMKRAGVTVAQEIPEEVLTEVARLYVRNMGLEGRGVTDEEMSSTISDTVKQTLATVGLTETAMRGAPSGPQTDMMSVDENAVQEQPVQRPLQEPESVPMPEAEPALDAQPEQPLAPEVDPELELQQAMRARMEQMRAEREAQAPEVDPELEMRQAMQARMAEVAAERAAAEEQAPPAAEDPVADPPGESTLDPGMRNSILLEMAAMDDAELSGYLEEGAFPDTLRPELEQIADESRLIRESQSGIAAEDEMIQSLPQRRLGDRVRPQEPEPEQSPALEQDAADVNQDDYVRRLGDLLSQPEIQDRMLAAARASDARDAEDAVQEEVMRLLDRAAQGERPVDLSNEGVASFLAKRANWRQSESRGRRLGRRETGLTDMMSGRVIDPASEAALNEEIAASPELQAVGTSEEVPAERNAERYWNGDRARATGKVQVVDGAEFEELLILEGTREGETVLVPTGAQKDRDTQRKHAEWRDQQEQFGRLHKPDVPARKDSTDVNSARPPRRLGRRQQPMPESQDSSRSEQGKSSESRDLPKIGDGRLISGVDSILADVQEIDGVRYELYNDNSLSGKGGAVRLYDVESGNTVEVRRFPDYDAAEAYHAEAVRKSSQGPSDNAAISAPAEPVVAGNAEQEPSQPGAAQSATDMSGRRDEVIEATIPDAQRFADESQRSVAVIEASDGQILAVPSDQIPDQVSVIRTINPQPKKRLGQKQADPARPETVPEPSSEAVPASTVGDAVMEPESAPGTRRDDITSATPGSGFSQFRSAVAAGSARDLLNTSMPAYTEMLRSKAYPVRDLQKKNTGWMIHQSGDSTLLIHPTDDYLIRFSPKSKKSGTQKLRAHTEATAYAIDNPISASRSADPEGELVVKEIFKEGSPSTPESGSMPRVQDERKTGGDSVSQPSGDQPESTGSSSSRPLSESILDRPREELHRIQQALDVKRSLGRRAAKQVETRLNRTPGGNVIRALLEVDGRESGFKEGFANRGQDAFKQAIDGRFTEADLSAASQWIETHFGTQGHAGRFVRGTVLSAERAPERTLVKIRNRKRNPKPVSPPVTLLQAVRQYGGISSQAVRPDYNIQEDFSQNGILSALATSSRTSTSGKGSLDAEQMAAELRSQGVWAPPNGHVYASDGEALIQALKSGAKTWYGEELQARDDIAAYEAEIKAIQEEADNVDESVTDEQIAEAVRSGAESGFAEGQDAEAEWGQEDRERFVNDFIGEVAGDANEEGLSDADDSFSFGSARKPSVPGQQQALFDSQEQGSLFNVARPARPAKQKSSAATSELERIEDELRARDRESLPGQMSLLEDSDQSPAATNMIEDGPKTAREKATEKRQKAQDDLVDAVKKAARGETLGAFDPDILDKAARLAFAVIEEGALTFAEYASSAIEKFGEQTARTYHRYFELAWETAGGMKDGLDAAGSLTDFIDSRTDMMSVSESESETGDDGGAEDTPGTPPKSPAPDDDLVSIRNAFVNEYRQSRGRDELGGAPRVSMEAMADEAVRRMTEEPGYEDRLVSDLSQNPGMIIDNYDNVVLTFRYRRLYDRAARAAERMREAQRSGDIDAQVQAQQDWEILDGQLNHNERVTKAVGTVQGRTLASRRFGLDSDYTLVDMVRQVQSERGGKSLDAETWAKVEELQKQIADQQATIDELRKAREERELNQAFEEHVDETVETVEKSRKRRGSKAKAKKELSDALADLRQAMRGIATGSTQGSIFAGTAELSKAAARVVAAYAKVGVNTFGEMIARVRHEIGADFAERGVDELRKEWDAAKQRGEIEAVELSTIEPGDARQLTRLARQIERALVEDGMRDRDQVLAGVHEALLELFPDLTSRQTMEILSGYGQFKPPTKDEVDLALYDINGQLRELAKIADMEEGKAPKRTGVQRPEQSDEYRRVKAAAEEMKRKGGYAVTDPEAELRSSLQAAKRAGLNAIADMTYELETGQRIVRGRTETIPDDELIDIRNRRDELRKAWREAFPPKERSEASRIAQAIRQVDRSIAEVERQIAANDFTKRKLGKKLSSPELDARRARLAELKAVRAELEEQQNPKMTPEERAALAYIRNLEQRRAEYMDRMQKGDFAPRQARKRTLSDKEAQAKKALDDTKAEFEKLRERERRKNRTYWESFWEGAGELLNFQRGMKASFDWSVVGVQGIKYLATHPVRGARDLVRSFMGGLTEISLSKLNDEIQSHPFYQASIDAGVEYTEIDGPASKQDEMFMGRLASRVPGMAVSARLWNAFANSMRISMFEAMVKSADPKRGLTKEEQKVVGRFVNIATGRGDMGRFKAASEAAAVALFSPKFLWSNVQYMYEPLRAVTHRDYTPELRRIIAKHYARHAAGVAAFYMLSQLAGWLLGGDDEEDEVTIEADPRSSDFAKVKIGDTRIDILGGMGQQIVFGSRMAAALAGIDNYKNRHGELLNLRDSRDRRQLTMDDVIWNFGRSKLAPGVSTGLELFTGRNFIGDPRTRRGAIFEAFVPMSILSAKENYETFGFASATILSLMSAAALNINTYGERTEYLGADTGDEDGVLDAIDDYYESFVRGEPAPTRPQIVEKWIKDARKDTDLPAYFDLLSEDDQGRVTEARRRRIGAAAVESVVSSGAPEWNRDDAGGKYADRVEEWRAERDEKAQWVRDNLEDETVRSELQAAFNSRQYRDLKDRPRKGERNSISRPKRKLGQSPEDYQLELQTWRERLESAEEMRSLLKSD